MRLTHVKARLERQIELSHLIANAYDTLAKVGLGNISLTGIQARLDTLKDDWERFSIVHDAVEIALRTLSPEDVTHVHDHSYFTEDLFATTRELYLDNTERISSLLDSEHGASLGPSSGHPDTHIQTGQPHYLQSRLPRIDLPKFNGTAADWISFKDLFTSLVINNSSLSSVERLQYLKTSLVGSAVPLLKDMAITNQNFQRAWDVLIAFYENKRLLVNTALHSLLTLKRMNKDSAIEMERLYMSITQIHRSLENLNRPVEAWDDFFVFIAVQRLDAESVKAWEHHLGSVTEPPTWTQFTEFLVSRLRSLQAFERSRSGKHSVQPTSLAIKTHYQGTSKAKDADKKPTCPLCSAKHYTFACSQYCTKSLQQKLALIKKHRLCYNCLGKHRVAMCKTTRRCLKCGRRHHTSIHPGSHSSDKGKNGSGEVTKPSTSKLEAEETKVLHSLSESTTSSLKVLLATAQVRVTAPNGNVMLVRALIDPGSETSLISERVVQHLKMTRQHHSASLVGIGGKHHNRTRGLVGFALSPHFPSEFECAITAHILPNLTSNIPSVQIDHTSWSHLEGLQLADRQFSRPGAIDLLLGADVYGSIITNGLTKGSPDSPIAQCTQLGWVISGPTGLTTSGASASRCYLNKEEDLHTVLQKFWELDQIPSSSNHSLAPDEQDCENHFRDTHSRDSQGRYIVRLPFKQSANQLGESKRKAICLVNRLHKRLKLDTNYGRMYSAFVGEYASLHHMELVPETTPEPSLCYYLPHHGVLKDTSHTTKLRVVFNGSSKTSSGLSLNDLLHVGPKLQTNIFNVLIWFRQFPYVFSSDMEKMFRQIKIHPDDWKFQRILWINEANVLETYQLTTVTYGLACAPFLALRTVDQLLKDEGDHFPLAVPTLVQGRYVDDLFGGADSIELAQLNVQQVNQLCMAGGFRLHQWTSNHPDVLKAIPERNRLSSSAVSIEEGLVVHSLGLSWHTSPDVFQFIYCQLSTNIPTKRIVLSTIAKLFDPLGFLSPVIIGAKILMQEIWTKQLDWDEPLPVTIANKWQLFNDGLQDLSGLTFPRWLGIRSQQSFEIHGFSDASPLAYAAVVYIRSFSEDGTVYTQLICSKAKVAPLKRMTIPRLELIAAAQLTKLVNLLLTIFGRTDIPIYMWTDSTVTYTWINNHPSRWKDFIHNRVCFIQEALPQAHWSLVSGKENPADLATRGITPAQLSEKNSWWLGPPWLSETISQWPQKPNSMEAVEIPEERSVKLASHITTFKDWDLISRYSSLARLCRMTAICRRVINRFRKIPHSSLLDPITTTELQDAEFFWIKAVQHSAYQRELELLSKGQSLPPSHPLAKLIPFRDAQGILRVGGRLQASSLSSDAKHPAILPNKSPLATLVIANAHERTLHGGTQITLCTIREKFWIMGGRVPIRSYILKCVKCTRFRRARAQQLMGQLPKERVTQSRPFLNTGVDYAGPFTIKTWRGRNARTYKGYLALFVCLSTSAIHVELVTDYTAEAFIAAYKRFTGRRGICATLFSDCGTNFKGADVALQRLFSEATAEARHLATLLSKDGTQWKFIPPSTPHFGGIWEAGVKSVKYHLHRIIGDTLLTYEEMTTLITQIEAILNSRPLSPISDDPEDISALTPGHFLMGCAPTTIPEPSLEGLRTSRLSRWQLISHMVDCFWTRWSKECLQRYLAISKWKTPTRTIEIGSLVLITDERYPPTKWSLGRVTEIHPGKDGLVRVATVKTQVTTLKRPIVKLCPLPIDVDTM